MAHTPADGLAVVDEVAAELNGHYRLDAVRAHLLELDGDRQGAHDHYQAAAHRATNLAEQRYLAAQASRLS
jgi:predicted RNA polymerase sigma factor